jgi:hypothetical protein
LVGDQFAGPEPKRWLLIDREVGVPDQKQGPNRWALDNLLVDQRGARTFFEVKRSTDIPILV